MPTRRALLMSIAGGLSTPSVRALQKRSLADPMRLGADLGLVESGLAKALQLGFARDTGVAVQLVPMPALPMLTALERGEIDAALANVPEAEQRLEREGLAHDRRVIAGGEFVLVGPAPVRGGVDLLEGLPGNDAVAALRKLATLGPGATGVLVLSAGDGSGAHVAEQALWREAQVAPAGAWYAAAQPGRPLIAQARALGAHAVVERGAWLAQAGAPLALRVSGDARLAEAVHLLRAFRVNHPAGKLFSGWIAGGRGHRIVAAQRGYRVASER